ncbi:response regulator [Solirubrobacter soli]|uniref:response regulator n=1 Tax=Solirubrobacter soli TaxID=363832 RepID=UPI00048887A1|nr:response regulator [Solirubrobacter soli]
MGDWAAVSASTASAEDAVAAAWPGAVQTLLDRVTVLEDAVAGLLAGDLGEDARETARREAHRLAGSLGAFGVAAGSVLARDLENALGGDVQIADAPLLAERVLSLRRAVEAGPPASTETDDAGPRVVFAGLAGSVSGPLLAAADGRGWRVTAARAVSSDEADVVLLGPGVGDVPGTIARLSRDGVAVAVLVEPSTDRLELVRSGARRVIGAELRPEAIVAELGALARDRGRNETSVLAVDDDPISLEIIAVALRSAGHVVTTLSDPLEFWNALERSRPDLVVLDVQMPGADGIELCRALRADPLWRGTPVLFLTATTSSGAVAELFAAGADDYVPKPVHPDELVARVSGRLERMGQARAGAQRDVATGLLRREAAEPLLERLLDLAVRMRLKYTVAALAVDGFDALDDATRERGMMLAGTVARLVLRMGDVGAVWGSGELVLGMVGSDETDVRRLLGDAIGSVADPELTGSAGVAEYPRDGDDLVSLVAAASATRRGAERDGGNRVAVAGGRPEGAKRVDVALVEDDEVLARLILDGLGTRGYRTRWLRDGEEAASELGGASPGVRAGLILLDWDLPSVDGLTVLRGLAADGTLAASRVVMLTARASQREILTALELGASDHIAKPFSLAVLLQRVERVLAH